MFSKSSNNKVKFQDAQLDDYVLENSVLKSKLQSKIDALTIMSKELDKCSMERDKYKVLVEQVKSKKCSGLSVVENGTNTYRLTHTNNISGGEMLAKTRDENNTLKLEVETLRSKLEEATGDIAAMRKQLQRDMAADIHGKKKSTSDPYTDKDYEQLVQQLEKIHKKYQQIQMDYRATLDEKEELVSDRDYYKNKVQRLNHQINYVLSNRVKTAQNEIDADPPKPIVDIDALVTENKYLHERITQLQIEKEIIKRTLSKYKSLLDNRSKSDAWNLKKGFADVMTQKQVRDFLDINSKTGLKRASTTELKSLCLGLFEALNDKSIALLHQRKTNQILANRITELEKTLESWCNGQKYIPVFPSQMLLEEFLPDIDSMKPEETRQSITNECEANKDKYSDSDDDMTKPQSDDSSDQSNSGVDNSHSEEKPLTGKIVLPIELQELVEEAIAELKANEDSAYKNKSLTM